MSEIFCRNPKIEESPLQTDLMLFDPVQSRFFVLNPTMAYIWRSCDGNTAFEQIVESIPRQFDESESHPVAAEMKTALEELLTLGLVTPAAQS